MAGNVVTTVFSGDDNLFQQAAKRVKAAMQGIAGFSANIGIFRVAQAGLSGIGSTAAGAAGGVRLLSGAFHGLMPILTAVTGVASAFAAVAKSIGQAAGEETAVFQFRNIAGGAADTESALAKLRQGSKETATTFQDFAKASRPLMEAGLSASDAADMTERLQKVSLMTGTSFEDMADIFARATMKEDLSMRDLAKLKAIPGIDVIAQQFKGLEHAVQDADFATKEQQAHLTEQAEHATAVYEEQAAQMSLAFEKESKQLSMAYEQAEKNADAVASIGEKIGIAKDAFESWKTGGSMQAVGDLGAFGDMINNQLLTGLTQLQKETGLSMDQIRMFAQQGKIGANDLLEAARRYREEKRKAAEFELQQRQAAQRFALEEKHRQEMLQIENERLRLETEQMERQKKLIEDQRALFGQVADAIRNAFSPEAFAKFFDTFDGKLRELGYNVNLIFKNFGDPLIDALKPVLDMINNQWAPALQQMATNFGKWIGNEITMFFNAWQTGDWSAVQKQAGDALQFGFKAATEFLFEQLQRVAIAFRDIIVDIFTGDNIRKALQGLATVFVDVGQVFGMMIASGLVKALAEAFKNVPVVGDWFKGASQKMDDLVNPDTVQEKLNQAFKAFGDFEAGVKGIATKIVQDWNTEIQKMEMPKLPESFIHPGGAAPTTPTTTTPVPAPAPETTGTTPEVPTTGAGTAPAAFGAAGVFGGTGGITSGQSGTGVEGLKTAAGWKPETWQEHWGLKPGESLDLSKSGYGSMEAAQHSYEMGNDMSRLTALVEEDNARTRAYYRGFVNPSDITFGGAAGKDALQNYLKGGAESGKTLTPADFGFFRGKTPQEILQEAEKRGLGPQAANDQKSHADLLASIDKGVGDLNKNLTTVLSIA